MKNFWTKLQLAEQFEMLQIILNNVKTVNRKVKNPGFPLKSLMYLENMEVWLKEDGAFVDTVVW
jgi:hypothetical protein